MLVSINALPFIVFLPVRCISPSVKGGQEQQITNGCPFLEFNDNFDLRIYFVFVFIRYANEPIFCYGIKLARLHDNLRSSLMQIGAKWYGLSDGVFTLRQLASYTHCNKKFCFVNIMCSIAIPPIRKSIKKLLRFGKKRSFPPEK